MGDRTVEALWGVGPKTTKGWQESLGSTPFTNLPIRAGQSHVRCEPRAVAAAEAEAIPKSSAGFRRAATPSPFTGSSPADQKMRSP